jgi:Holliday junction resolvase RusA-like endonuclease
MSNLQISFTIPGKPIPLKRHRSTTGGRMYDPSSKDKKGMWLQIAKYCPKLPIVGDVYMKVIFYMDRPKNHYRTGKYAHLLKEGIPERHSIRPDLDNLVKMIADVIQGKDRMICDDSQICILQAEKIYGIPTRTEVFIEEIS